MHSFKSKFIVFFGLFILCSCIIIAGLSSRSIFKTGEILASEQGKPVCEKALKAINADLFAKFLEHPSEEDPYYETTRIALLAIKESAGCSYLYTMAPVQGTTYQYIIDGSCEPDDEENFSALGDEEDISHYGRAPFEAMRTGGLTNSGLTNLGEWGYQVSTYQAIRTSNGKIVGFIGCDFPIDKVMATMKSQITFIIIISILCVIIGILMIYIFTKRMFSQMNTVTSALEQIGQGNANLKTRIPMHGNNEITQLADNFNAFSEKIHHIISVMKSSKDELLTAGVTLSDTADDTSSAINQIADSMEMISSNLHGQSQNVEQTAAKVNQIIKDITDLGKLVSEQAAIVQTASSAIGKMIGNISEVNNFVDQMASSFEKLQSDAESGVKTQNEMQTEIMQIENQSKLLSEANTVIANIASQTNLLAMNAAIEAAHAGEAGNGFAVVADEIRKLSETSSTQSKTIGTQLNAIQNTIKTVVAATQQGVKGYAHLAEEIRETDKVVQHIKVAMNEQTDGSSQITNALRDLNQSTSMVQDASKQMSDGSRSIMNEIQTLQHENDTIKHNMNEISSSISLIKQTDNALSNISSLMKQSIDSIGNQVDKFEV